MSKFYFPQKARWISMIGPDAAEFLNRLTTVNVNRVQQKEGAPGAFLNAQGKFRATFTLWKIADQEFGLETEEAESLLKTIDTFTFSEKMTVTLIDGLKCAWILGDSFSLAPFHTQAIEPEIRISNHGETDFGTPWISAWALPATLDHWITQIKADSFTDEALLELNISQCRPRVGVEVTEETSPLEVGLCDWVAINKGCYPGQEIIEKTQALGSPARRMIQIEGDILDQGFHLAATEKTIPLFNAAESPTEVGKITSIVRQGNRFKALALVRKNYINLGLEIQALTNSIPTLRGKITKVAPYQ